MFMMRKKEFFNQQTISGALTAQVQGGEVKQGQLQEAWTGQDLQQLPVGLHHGGHGGGLGED